MSGDTFASIVALVITVVIVALFISLLFSCGADTSSSGSSYTSSLTCRSCGRSAEIGDYEYYTIKRTNMCDNCYANFQWAQNALGN